MTTTRGAPTVAALFMITEETPASAVTREILDEALRIADTRYPDGERIDWEDVWDHLDSFALADGAELDIDTVWGPAIARIKRHVNDARRNS